MARPKNKYHYDEKRDRWDTSIYVENELGQKVRIPLHAKTWEDLDELVQKEKKNAAKVKNYKEKRNTTLEEYAAKWMDDNKHTLAPKTYSSYESHLKLYIIPILGNKKLMDLELDDVQNFLNLLHDVGGVAGEDLSKSTLAGIRVTLHACLQHAKVRHYMEANPVDGTKIPRGRPAGERISITAEQLEHLLAVAKSGEYAFSSKQSKFQNSPERQYLIKLVYHASNLAALTGMRYGEVFGLKWRYLNLDSGFLLVASNITETDVIHEGDLKNHQKRLIRLTEKAIQELREWKKIYDEYVELSKGHFYNELDLVFANSTGGFMRNANFRKRYWMKLVKYCNLPTKFSFHCLRHTHITMLLRAGVDLASVAARAGHLDSSVTNKIYRHEIEAINDASVEVMEKLGF